MSLSSLFEKISLLPSISPFAFKSRRIATKGVTPAPPAINIPFPLYFIAPHAFPISKWVASQIKYNLRKQYPEDYFSLFGSITDENFIEPDEINFNEDITKEKL